MHPVRFGVRALALRLRLAVMMRRRSLPDLLKALTPSSLQTNRNGKAPLSAIKKSLSDAENLIAHVPLAPDTCLYRALSRYAILRSAGHPARFVMGIKPDSDEIAGHAWVELSGEPFDEDVDPSLVVTFAYPEPFGSIGTAL